MKCWTCDSSKVSVFLDLGVPALAGAFLSPDDFDVEDRRLLRVGFCEDCNIVQVVDPVPPRQLFQSYRYLSGATLTGRNHFTAYAADLVARFNVRSALEIGCNDGLMLKALADMGVPKLIGVDPAKNIVALGRDPRIVVLNDYFESYLAKRIGRFDLIVANNVLAHVEDLHGCLAAIHDSLADRGVFVCEVHDLSELVAGRQYDAIYHEHRYYYSFTSLQRLLAQHGIEAFDVRKPALHGGTIRVYCGHRGVHRLNYTVNKALASDEKRQLGRLATYQLFSDRAQSHRASLTGLVRSLRAEGKTIAAYGASGRANTLIQWCGFTAGDIAYIVDESPARAGLYTPGSHIPVVGRGALEKTPPDYLLITAWTYAQEIFGKLGDYAGGVLMPFPEPRVLSEKAAA